MALNFGSMDIFLTTGKGVGKTPIAAFDSALGGKMWAESLGENKGSTFSFTLPYALH